MEHQETVHVVMRVNGGGYKAAPVKAFDDRKDAREYARRMNARTMNFHYSVKSVKKG